MELLDRYLQAVRRHLPRAPQQDILAELRANLEAQLDDRESALGRPLTQGETEDWLRAMGPPWQVAARYLPQQCLIGPAIFPMYWYALRMALLWALAIYAIVSAVLVLLGAPGAHNVSVAVMRTPGVLFTVAAWVTLIFAGLEFFAVRSPGTCAPWLRQVTQWSPASLPPLEKQHVKGTPRNFARAMAEFVFELLFFGWLLVFPHYPFLLLGPGVVFLHQSPFEMTHAVVVFYFWIVGLNAFQLVWHGVDLARGGWQRSRRIQHIFFKAYALIPTMVLLEAPGHMLLRLKHPGMDAAHYAGTLSQINDGVHKGLLVVLAIAVLQLGWDLWQWWRDGRGVRVAA